MFLKVFKTHERIEVLYGHFIDGDGTNVIEARERNKSDRLVFLNAHLGLTKWKGQKSAAN